MKKTNKNINEWNGAGFSMSSTRGRGGVNRGSFSGALNMGGPNGMYTYEIKPLNRLLQQKPEKYYKNETIKDGGFIEGEELNKRDGIKHRGTLLRTEKSESGRVKYYVILCDKTNRSMKIDPTSAVLLSGMTEPLNYIQDIKNKNKRNTKAKLVRESLNEDWYNDEGDLIKGDPIAPEHQMPKTKTLTSYVIIPRSAKMLEGLKLMAEHANVKLDIISVKGFINQRIDFSISGSERNLDKFISVFNDTLDEYKELSGF